MLLYKRHEINLCDLFRVANFWYVTTCNLQPAAHSLLVKAARFYEPSVGLYVQQITRCHISEERNLHSHCHEDFKSHSE